MQNKRGRKPGNTRITNKEYLNFVQNKAITPMYQEEFDAALAKVSFRNKTKEEQAKRFLWLLYKTGRRPAELLVLTPNDFTDKKIKDLTTGRSMRIVELNIKTLKKGSQSTLPLPFEPFKEFYLWAKNKLPGYPLFYLWIPKKQTRTQVYKTKDGPVTKQAPYLTPLVSKLSKYFRFSIYMFRHNRFTIMSENGADKEDLRLAKGAKDDRSVFVYLGFSSKKKMRLSPFYK